MNLVYLFASSSLNVVFRVLFRARIFHADRVPMHGPAVLACNHASFMDPPLLGAVSPRELNFLAREDLFRYPGICWFLHQLNAVPVDRDGGGGAGLKAIFDRLLKGKAILLFPEGTRSADGRLKPARSGIGLVVIKTNAPVIPVRVFGTFEAWGRNRRFPILHPIQVTFGEPMDFTSLREEARTCSKPRLKVIYQEVADQIMGTIAKLQPWEEKSRFP